jgi:hypothetical protein
MGRESPLVKFCEPADKQLEIRILTDECVMLDAIDWTMA